MSVDFHRGERIGRYQVLTQLSVGGMAELFLGFTSGPGGFRKYVVIKRVLPDARSDAAFERMFLDEARITAAFEHPNIAQVFELGQDDGLFLAMEFVAGQNLYQVTRACERRREPLPGGFSLAVARDVCLALHYAHTFTTPAGRRSPVIHRDVAQKNVMVRYDGAVKLLDFGVAKARGSLERTRTGMVKGTTGYMSPEQVRGEPLDARSDIFSVGVMLYEMLAGERLFQGRTEHEEMVLNLEAPIEPLEARAKVPAAVSAVVMKALERDREQRFASAREMARALELAGGRLLFNEEQRAAFMRKLFEERMAATQQLLESADEAEEEVVVTAVMKVLKEDGGVAALEHAKPKSDERSRPAREEGRQPARGSGKGPRPVREEPRASEREREARGSAPAAVASAVSASGTRAPPKKEETGKKGGRALWAVVLGVLLVGGGFGVVKLLSEMEPPSEPAPVGDLSPMLLIPQEPRLRTHPEPEDEKEVARPPPEEVKEAKEVKEAERSEPPKVVKEAEKSEPSKVVKQGLLTLVVLPEADVFRGEVLIGRTPMFKKSLPAGTHLLRLEGADGKTRMLSVPVEAGRTATFKLKLEEIPEVDEVPDLEESPGE
jgi:eukaryotic-like serine/threonine-protein kinase